MAAIYDKDGEYKQKYIESKMSNQTAASDDNANNENVENEQINEENEQE